MNSKKKHKIFVGMSGGVDSSVSAALLKREGYDVTGVFIKVWQPDFIECTWKEDRRDAMRVAAVLNIPFLTLNLEKEYKKEVVDYMIREYKAGRTPNPDVICNKEIKFGAFLKVARKLGAGYVATGHYARVKELIIKNKELTVKTFKLLEGRDKNKDQSYFLWTLTQKELKHILFPVGDLKKTEVRKMAKKFQLPNFDKKDSQGLCFIGKIDMKDFLKNYLKSKKGKVVNERGKVIGYHDGAYFFTIGQRHGFTIAKKGIKNQPHYVVMKDIKKNILVVSNQRQIRKDKLGVTGCKLENVNWITAQHHFWDSSKSGAGRIRYRGEKQKLSLVQSGATTKVKFEKPQQGLASGQSLVLYQGEECIGGGIFNV